MVINAGAVQLRSDFRHDRTPLPYLPPMPNPPFLSPGTIPTHSHLLRRSSGIPLSGVFMISLNTSVARCNLFTSSLRLNAKAIDETIIKTTARIGTANDLILIQTHPR